MSKKNDNIKIQCWSGKILFEGKCTDKKVDKVLDANRCTECEGKDHCSVCDDTGYAGDFSVEWEDEDRDDNVYEHINY